MQLVVGLVAPWMMGADQAWGDGILPLELLFLT